MRRPNHVLAVAALMAVALTAGCGLKQEQLDALKQQQTAPGQTDTNGLTTGGTTGVPGTTGGTTGALATTGGTTGVIGTTGGATGTTGTTGGTTGGSTTGATGGPTGGTTGAQQVKCSTLGQNVPGITPTEIRVGVHAPVTGAAPLPANSFRDGLQAYWKSPAHKVCGRTVTIDFQDDKYTPQTARDVCGPMSRRDFIVIGAAGTDQIQSCATMPDIAGKGVPYLSAGVTTNGLTTLQHYFALTLTYAQQADLVLRNAKAQGYGMKKWAVVTSNTNNFKDAREAMEATLSGAGFQKGCATTSTAPCYVDIQVDASSSGNIQTRAAGTGSTIANGGFDTVFVDTSPGYWIYMQSTANTFSGNWVGPGVTMTEVTVAQLACKANPIIKANFLAPYPGLDRATSEFKAANNNSYDDIYWSLWGLSQAIQQVLDASSSLTRPAFIASLRDASLPGGVYAPERFNGGHFGGTGAYSLRINCSETQPNQNDPGSWDTVGGLLTK